MTIKPVFIRNDPVKNRELLSVKSFLPSLLFFPAQLYHAIQVHLLLFSNIFTTLNNKLARVILQAVELSIVTEREQGFEMILQLSFAILSLTSLH